MTGKGAHSPINSRSLMNIRQIYYQHACVGAYPSSARVATHRRALRCRLGRQDGQVSLNGHATISGDILHSARRSRWLQAAGAPPRRHVRAHSFSRSTEQPPPGQLELRNEPKGGPHRAGPSAPCGNKTWCDSVSGWARGCSCWSTAATSLSL